MQPLNPFLAAFFKSSVVAQCSPVHHYVLLVPLTDLLFTHRETENGASVADLVASDDFLTSHVLRIPPSAKEKDSVGQSLRDVRGKAKKFSTLNGRSVLVRDSIIFTGKGFKTLAQAQILSDATWYPDVLEPRQWLLYFVSRPLVGTWEEVKLSPAVLVHGVRDREMRALEQTKVQAAESAESSVPRKKDVRTFHDLLENFPMIARQMHVGLEKLFVEFSAVFQKPLPLPPSASNIPDPRPMGPIEAATKRARSESLGMRNGDGPGPPAKLPVTEDFYAEDDEDVMRAALETAVTAAIDLFQGVDKQQLSLLGATTDLTGPLVEKLIERYVAENVHHLLFPKLAVIKRPEDLVLEARIRKMEFIDVSQLGIAIDGGPRAKLDLLIQLGPVTDEFKKISGAQSPGDMMDALLATTKAVSRLAPASGAADGSQEPASEKPMLTANADTLVSLLLFVVIRSQVRNLQARIAYVRNFIFIDDIESGELGYALSTFEAVLAYLLMDSSGLYKASRRNKALWEATKRGDVAKLRSIMEPSTSAVDEGDGDYDDLFGDGAGDEEKRIPDDGPRSPLKARRRPSLTAWNLMNGSRVTSSLGPVVSDPCNGSGLSHVFPFQTNGDELPPVKRIKRVAMDTRSMSSGSEISFQSRTTSLGTNGSAIEGDISVARLAQTTDAFGESVLMMAVQHRQTAALRYLLSLSGYYPMDVVLQDMNVERTTLLSAATQLGHAELMDMMLDHVVSQATGRQLSQYLSEQDVRGRSMGHYLFHAPHLIRRIGPMIPWRQRDKNGQTPLFALCRSYDHADYHSMVEAGLTAARESQGDGQPLHVDEHVDGKGNTLLHIINDARLAARILQHGDVDVNATNEKRFTPLMVASKYGRYDMVRCLFADARVDVAARELRGLTAVELAKDDDVRNKIDDLGLFSTPAGRDGRITGVLHGDDEPTVAGGAGADGAAAGTGAPGVVDPDADGDAVAVPAADEAVAGAAARYTAPGRLVPAHHAGSPDAGDARDAVGVLPGAGAAAGRHGAADAAQAGDEAREDQGRVRAGRGRWRGGAVCPSREGDGEERRLLDQGSGEKGEWRGDGGFGSVRLDGAAAQTGGGGAVHAALAPGRGRVLRQGHGAGTVERAGDVAHDAAGDAVDGAGATVVAFATGATDRAVPDGA
ncbi:hypothetical protein XA68_14413 [Ophiocordyceps unilateralis]|uniref:VPS9 domain-containing protein n=1 Tax=Ophiocordyceps unilateralis TaxID=268505 RepID=A0A2A9P9N7_OPHUN|nr:hypothetical protein XA68_14413 [Ophiocordyceps unilateralis]